MQVQIEDIKAQNEHLYQTTVQLFQTLLDRVQAAEARIKVLESQAARPRTKRMATDYPTYCVVKSLADQGLTEQAINKQIGIPYTTVRSYLRWDEDTIHKRRQEWDKRVATAQKKNKPDPVPHYVKASGGEALTGGLMSQLDDPEEVPKVAPAPIPVVYPSKEPAAPEQEPRPAYGGVMNPAPAAAASYMAPPSPSVPGFCPGHSAIPDTVPTSEDDEYDDEDDILDADYTEPF